MSGGIIHFIFVIGFVLMPGLSHAYGDADGTGAQTENGKSTDCEEALSRFQQRVLEDDIHSLRPSVAEQIQLLARSPEIEFWLKVLFILKKEQAGFSSVYMLPKGDQQLTEDEKARVFAAHPEDKFQRPTTESEWRQFYWNHVQGQIRFAAKQFKTTLIRSLAPDLDMKPDRIFDAVFMPTVIEDCTVDADRILTELRQITPEMLRSEQTRRRIDLSSLGPKPCCKTQGGCYDCFHNRRHLKPSGE